MSPPTNSSHGLSHGPYSSVPRTALEYGPWDNQWEEFVGGEINFVRNFSLSPFETIVMDYSVIDSCDYLCDTGNRPPQRNFVLNRKGPLRIKIFSSHRIQSKIYEQKFPKRTQTARRPDTVLLYHKYSSYEKNRLFFLHVVCYNLHSTSRIREINIGSYN